jgi:hypothetical protein
MLEEAYRGSLALSLHTYLTPFSAKRSEKGALYKFELIELF